MTPTADQKRVCNVMYEVCSGRGVDVKINGWSVSYVTDQRGRARVTVCDSDFVTDKRAEKEQ